MENEKFIHIVEELQDKLDDEEFSILAVVARNLWLRRNTVIFGGISNYPNLILRKALESIEEFKIANDRPWAENEGSSSIQNWKALW
jgi:hypothetical protein